MTRKQIEQIERKLTLLSKKSDKTEDRIERSKQEGNLKKARDNELKLKSQLGAIEAILQTLDILGYSVKWTGNDLNDAIIIKRDGD